MPLSQDSPTEEDVRSGFGTQDELHPSELVEGGSINKAISIETLRKAIPPHCFKPSVLWSSLYFVRDLVYSAILLLVLRHLLTSTLVKESSILYYATVITYGFLQGIVWTGLWIIAHDCGHSSFSTSSVVNDCVGFVLHSALLAPYFSWKSTHRRHHIYANHIEKDLNYVPLRRDSYAKKLGIDPEMLSEMGEDAPVVLLLRILLQQTIGWNWYILSNITCPPTAVVKKDMSVWRHSHFDPWGAMFRSSEAVAVLLSDIGCLATITALYHLYLMFGSFELLFWVYIVPWTWVNHWIVMITYLHHTHPSVPKYTKDSWTFIRGATATIDRDFGIIGTHFFHHISSDHVTHHLFSKIPHYYTREASDAVVPLLGSHYHGRGSFEYKDLRQAFRECQFVEEDEEKDADFGLLSKHETEKEATAKTTQEINPRNQALWYRKGMSPAPEFRMREASLAAEPAVQKA